MTAGALLPHHGIQLNNMKKLLFVLLLIIPLSCQKDEAREPELKSTHLTIPWVKCVNNHYTVGSCGTVFYPPIVKCPTCGAAIIDSGNMDCGEA